MSQEKNSDKNALSRLGEELANDILDASDPDIIAEAKEDGIDPALLAADMRALLEKSLAGKKKARLVAAQAAVSANRRQTGFVVPFDAVVARQRLKKVLANNPDAAGGLTLAARNEGDDLSDEDVRGMLEDFEELGIIPPASEEP